MSLYDLLIQGAGDTFIQPGMLGGATLQAPRADLGVSPGLLGGATLFDPSVGLIGAAGVSELGTRVFVQGIVDEDGTRWISGSVSEFGDWRSGSETQTVLPALLGQGILFAPDVQAPGVFPDRLGQALLLGFTTTVQVGELPFPNGAGGAADLFSPRIDRGVAPSLIGAASIFNVVVGSVDVQVPLLGPALLPTPGIARHVSPGMLGQGQIFAASIGPMPPLLGPAQLFAPQVGFEGTGRLKALVVLDAWINAKAEVA